MQRRLAEDEDRVDIRHYAEVLWRRKLIIIVVTAVACALAVAMSLRQPNLYRSSAAILLQGSEAERRLGASDEPASFAYNRVETEIGVIESELVREAVAEELGYEPGVSVGAVGDTDIVQISATSREPQRAAEIANTYAQVYVEWRRTRTVNDLLAAQQTVQAELDVLEDQIAELEAPIEELETDLFVSQDLEEREVIRDQIAAVEEQISVEREALQSQIALYRQELSSLQVSQRITRTGGVQIVSNGSVPSDPFAPQPLRNGVLGAVVGLMLGVGAAFLLETLDDRVRSKEQLEAVTGWPTLGLIPVIPKARRGEHDLVTLESPTSPPAEAYRTLRTAVQFMGLEHPIQVIQVTSANSGDGKTTTAANLAVTLAKADNRVVLIDADLRRPRLHEEFGVSNASGFTSALLGTAKPEDTFHRVGRHGLILMPSGPPPPNPSELLALGRTRDLILRLREQSDIIVIDSPPVLPVTDPLVLSAYVDGVLLVTDAATAKARELKRTRELLQQVNANVIGITVNRVSADAGYAGYGYGYGYGYTSEIQGDPPVAEHADDVERVSTGFFRR
jgi:succinoglycan biosynthesis transport protein ExoP